MTSPGLRLARRSSGELRGYQSGAMVRGTRPRPFAGQRMLTVVGLFALGVLAIKAVQAVMASTAQLAVVFVAFAMILVPYFLIFRLILGRRAGAVVRGVVRTGPRIAGALIGAVPRPRGATSVANGARAAIRAGRVIRHIPVRNLQVRPVTGGPPVPCLLRGEPDGAEPQDGDLLRLLGRTDRSGDFVARRIEILAPDGSRALRVIRGRLTGPIAMTAWWSRLCYGASAVVGIWAAATLIDIIR